MSDMDDIRGAMDGHNRRLARLHKEREMHSNMAVVMVLVLTAASLAWAEFLVDGERTRWIKDCAEARPLEDCKVDAMELYGEE